MLLLVAASHVEMISLPAFKRRDPKNKTNFSSHHAAHFPSIIALILSSEPEKSSHTEYVCVEQQAAKLEVLVKISTCLQIHKPSGQWPL